MEQRCIGNRSEFVGKNAIFPLEKVRLGDWGNPFRLWVLGGVLKREANFVIGDAERI